MNHFSNFAALLSTELHFYLMEHHQSLPADAIVVFEVAGEEDFNKWHEKISVLNRKDDQPIVKVKVQEWRRHSAIEKLTFVKAVA